MDQAPPHSDGEVSSSYDDGGVMRFAWPYDPIAP